MDDRLTILRDRVDYWVDVCEPLGLGHWRIDVEIVEEPHGKMGSNAAVQLSGYYDNATIEFASIIFEEHGDEEIDEIIVHELLHIVFRDFWDAVTEPEYLFGKPAWTSHYNRLDHEAEGVIDRMARSIVLVHQLDWTDVVQSDDTDKESNEPCTP